MRVVRSWLEEYVDLSGFTDEQICDVLTDLGHEVEKTTLEDELDPLVVVGLITAVNPHPDAARLRLCTVELGTDHPFEIVCGASNVRSRMNVAVAQVGAVLPGDKKPLKPAQIRGVESRGMICSSAELGWGFSGNEDGILELGPGLSPGQSVGEIWGGRDTIWELAITPNRADCLGYIGLARDLGAKLSRPLVLPSLEYPLSDLSSKDHIKIHLGDSQHCSRFVALYIDRLHGHAHAPLWMQRRLLLAGVRPRSLIVDVTNYVLYEWGQPIHAYDYRAVSGQVLNVGTAAQGGHESLKTLDGTIRNLHGEDLVISDAQGALSLAGVMGGQSSWVADDTRACVIEVADFDGRSIRQTVKRHKLSSDSSHRFERGVDGCALIDVAKRVAHLLYQLAEELSLPLPRISRDVVDVQKSAYLAPRVALRVERARKLLGCNDLTVERCMDILDALECHLLDRKGSRLVYAIPSHRGDLSREVDLIEEIARMLSYSSLPSLPPSSCCNVPAYVGMSYSAGETLGHSPREYLEGRAGQEGEQREVSEGVSPQEPPNAMNRSSCFGGASRGDGYVYYLRAVRNLVASMGLYEVILYPFVSRREVRSALVPPGHLLDPSLKIENPLSEDYAYLQTTQLFSMVRSLKHNRAHRHRGGRFFQIGRGYWARGVVESLRSGPRATGHGIWHDLWDYVGSVSVSDGARNGGGDNIYSRPHMATEVRPREGDLLTCLVDGPWQKKNWAHREAVELTFYHLREILEHVLAGLSVEGYELRKLSDTGDELPFLHPTQSATIWLRGSLASDNKAMLASELGDGPSSGAELRAEKNTPEYACLGYLGMLHPRVCDGGDLGLRDRPGMIEIYLEKLMTFNLNTEGRGSAVAPSVMGVVSWERMIVILRGFRSQAILHVFVISLWWSLNLWNMAQ